MKEIDISKYRGIFVSETREYLTQLNQYIIDLEREPQKKEIIEAIFRNYHTIKGMAGTMGYKIIETLAHLLEDLLTSIRNGSLLVNSDIIDMMLEGTDKIELLIENPGRKDKEIQSFISKISNAKGTTKKEKVPEKIFEKVICEVVLKKDIQLKEARAVVLISNLENMAEITDYSPDRSSIESGDFEERFYLTIVPKVSLDKIKESLLEYSDVKAVNFKDVGRKVETITGVTKKSDIRVDIKKLDDLQNLLSELVISKESLKGFAKVGDNESILNETERIASIVSNLQDEVVKIRMVPIWQVFERFPRVIRDVSKELGKEVNFEIKGKDIEIDPCLRILQNRCSIFLEILYIMG